MRLSQNRGSDCNISWFILVVLPLRNSEVVYAGKVDSLANQYGESVHLSLVPTSGFGNKPAQLLCNRD